MTRFDETWHRLLDWTQGQAPSERLAALLLNEEGYDVIDPSHPLGGKDKGADATCSKDGQPWVMAVYFPRGQQTITITAKLESDIEAARGRNPVGIAFVTNQELRLAERERLKNLGGDILIDIFHLERITTILDRPHMSQVRKQFLDIDAGPPAILITAEVVGGASYFDDGDDLLDRMVNIERKALERRAQKLREDPPDPYHHRLVAPMLRNMGYTNVSDEPDKPMTVDEIEQKVEQFHDELAGRWDRCLDYLAAAARPALRFRIINLAKSFLINVEVILMFHGAEGVKNVDAEDFKLQRQQDPDWLEPVGQFGVRMPLDLPLPADYPAHFRNVDGGLRVTINLAQLRPLPPWESEHEDVVLIVRDHSLDAVNVTYTATAQGYGEAFVGDPITVPVEAVSSVDALRYALESSKDHDE